MFLILTKSNHYQIRVSHERISYYYVDNDFTQIGIDDFEVYVKESPEIIDKMIQIGRDYEYLFISKKILDEFMQSDCNKFVGL